MGGGNGGISLAARLRHIGCRDVAVIAPDPLHRYRPLLNYVGGGPPSMSRLTRPMTSVIPSGCTWLPHRAVAVHPDEREVELDTGERVGYGDLVVAPGLEPDLAAIPRPGRGDGCRMVSHRAPQLSRRGHLGGHQGYDAWPGGLHDPFRAGTVRRHGVTPCTTTRRSRRGLVDIDSSALAHHRLPRVWSLGDVAHVQTRPSGGTLRSQVEVLADNIRRGRTGESLRHYDGYTIIPITVDRRCLLLAEFDRTGTPQPTTTLIDLTVPRRLLWAFDRYVEPVVYFRALLKGRV